MSQIISSHSPEVAESLFPKAAANHLAKLPGMEQVDESLLMAISSEYRTPVDISMAACDLREGSGLRPEDICRDLGILRLMLMDREDLCLEADPGLLTTFKRTDANQKLHADSQLNLDHFLDKGVAAVVPPRYKERAQQALGADARKVPLLERLKAERIVIANGFENSRTLHLLHDVVDHVWLFEHLRTNGLFRKYADFFTSIDFGDEAFLYSRQSELISTVGFGSRRLPLTKKSGVPTTLNANGIELLLSDEEDERADNALGLFKDMPEEKQDWCLSVIENMAIQLADERRRWGTIKQLDPKIGEKRPMALLDPLYVSFLIEAISTLQGDENEQRFARIQYGVAATIEKFLERMLEDPTTETTETVHGNNVFLEHPPVINKSVEDWIRSRLFFTTSYVRTD